MKSTEYGEILEATRSELYEKYWKEEYSKMWTFPQFLSNVTKGGTRIIDDSKSWEQLEKENSEMKNLLISVVKIYQTGSHDGVESIVGSIGDYLKTMGDIK